jgi:hypothetical protein
MATDLGVFNWPSGSGGSGGDVFAQGVYNMPSGQSTFTVAYDVTLASAIPPIFSIVNTVDGSPIFLIAYVSAFSTSGFTVTTNAPTDTANYQLVYSVMGPV